MSDKSFKLCYVVNNMLYFTDNFENQWGDDWDDAPYEHNAGTPYEIIKELKDNKHRGNLRYIVYVDLDVKQPCDYYGSNSPYSVEMINKGAIPWLSSVKYGNISAGTTIDEVKKWLKKTGCKWAELE